MRKLQWIFFGLYLIAVAVGAGVGGAGAFPGGAHTGSS